MSANASIGNILTRLGGLKNVSDRSEKRRVMDDADFLQSLAQPEMDVENTAQALPNFANFQPPEPNLPESDLGGELTAQSYDVRANAATPPPDEEPNFLQKLGRALGDYFSPQKREEATNYNRELMQKAQGVGQTPPIATEQVDLEEGLPPVTSSEQLAGFSPMMRAPSNEMISNLGQALSSYFSPLSEDVTNQNRQMVENAQLRSQGFNPDEYRAQQNQAKAKEQTDINQRMDKALENPGETAVYGAADIVANQPDLQAQFNKFTGINFDDQIAKQTSEYEKILQDMEDNLNEEGTGYSEQEQRIKQRILANQATDADKFYIGLAVLMPLLAGAFFGKEAGLGALAGGAKGIADVLGQRQKSNFENEELLADIGKKKGDLELRKGELGLKRAALPSEIMKNLPKDENAHLVNKNEVKWRDPATGEERSGFEIKPGLVARPEFVTDKEELKEMRKEAIDLSAAVNATKEINMLTSDIIDITDKLKDKNFFGQALASVVSGKDPGLATKLGEEIEYNGRKVNSYVVLEHKLKLLVDAYRQAKSMRALTNTVQEHIEGLFRNPAASFQSYADTKDQMLYTRDLAQNRLMDNASSSGFVPEFIARELQPEAKKVYGKLNKKAGEKEASELLRE